jgi:hypothetical protein
VLSDYALMVFEMFCFLIVEIFSEQEVLACFYEMTYTLYNQTPTQRSDLDPRKNVTPKMKDPNTLEKFDKR